jgi:hypothetical protein
MTESTEHNKKLIEHLSSEIETHTKALMDFRTKINFTLFISPFIVLGACILAVKDLHVVINYNLHFIIAVTCLIFSWIALGVAAGRFEKHIWDQCNHWRKIIFRLQSPSSPIVTEKDIIFEHSIIKSYVWVHCILLIGFGAAVFILFTNTPQSVEKNILPGRSTNTLNSDSTGHINK